MIPAAFEFHAPAYLAQATRAAREARASRRCSGRTEPHPVMKLSLAMPRHVRGHSLHPGPRYVRGRNGAVPIRRRSPARAIEEAEIVARRYSLLHDTSRVIADPLVAKPRHGWRPTSPTRIPPNDPFPPPCSRSAPRSSRTVRAASAASPSHPSSRALRTPLQAVRDPHEIACRRRRRRSGGAYLKMERKVGDFARRRGGPALARRRRRLRAGGDRSPTNVGLTPIKATEAEAACAAKTLGRGAQSRGERAAPPRPSRCEDLGGSVEYKRDLVGCDGRRDSARPSERARRGA
jgi:carbon-monoxide dehydrogenase medium subunit